MLAGDSTDFFFLSFYSSSDLQCALQVSDHENIEIIW